MAESVICAHRSVWVGSQQSAQASVLLSWSCWWSGSCCGVHWQSPQFSKQVPSPSLVLLACCARERYNSNWETNQQQTPPKTTHYIYLYYWVNWVSACFYIKRQRYVLRYLSSRALKTLSVALVKYVCITWRHFQSSCGSSFPYYSLLQCQTLCSALSFSVLCSRLSARRGKQTGMTVGVFFFYRNLFDDKSQKRNEFVIVIKQKCSSLTKTPPLPRLQNCPFSQTPSSLHSAQCFLWDCTLTGPVWVLDPVWHYLGNQQVFPWET